MNRFSSTVLRTAIQRVVRLAAVLTILTAALPGGLAAGTAGAADYQKGPASALAECEAQALPYRQQETPPYEGLASLRNDDMGYDLWRPVDWGFATEDPAAVVLAPDSEEQGARFSIYTLDAPGPTSVDDLQWRNDWFSWIMWMSSAGPDTRIISASRFWSDNISGLDGRYTYQDGDTRISRWVRLLYVGSRQYYLVAEAPATADSEEAQSAFLTMMVTFHPDEQLDLGALDLCLAERGG